MPRNLNLNEMHFSSVVARPQQSGLRLSATLRFDYERKNMTAYSRTDRRLLGFDMGDWSIIGGGLALVALLTLLF
jgi:hypothetical protein